MPWSRESKQPNAPGPHFLARHQAPAPPTGANLRFWSDGIFNNGIMQKIDDVVAERAADRSGTPSRDSTHAWHSRAQLSFETALLAYAAT
jgi:hypothetical protein